jgi:hypothetical protein
MERLKYDWQGTRYVPARFGDSVKKAGKFFDQFSLAELSLPAV